jgi:NADPH:quinone reductase-like Zn-dependent oxidoreductase
MFTAIVTDKDESGYRSELRELSEQDLPDGDVTVRVAYSTLNYKDGLAITGKGPRRAAVPDGARHRPRRGRRVERPPVVLSR